MESLEDIRKREKKEDEEMKIKGFDLLCEVLSSEDSREMKIKQRKKKIDNILKYYT